MGGKIVVPSNPGVLLNDAENTLFKFSNYLLREF
jgi:hypothetical protein